MDGWMDGWLDGWMEHYQSTNGKRNSVSNTESRWVSETAVVHLACDKEDMGRNVTVTTVQ
jgi:hypothetical protein